MTALQCREKLNQLKNMYNAVRPNLLETLQLLVAYLFLKMHATHEPSKKTTDNAVPLSILRGPSHHIAILVLFHHLQKRFF